MGKKLICLCNLVNEDEIISSLRKGAYSTTHIQQLTKAGTTCGRCLPEIDQIVTDFRKKMPKDLQIKLDFGQ